MLKGHTDDMAEKWTRERRREHTRELLLDAAKEVFARRGFEGAALEEIAQNAGFTRGAIYKHFRDKEELFVAVNERFNRDFLEQFVDTIDPATPLEDVDLSLIAKMWHAAEEREPRDFALTLENNLYLLRNPHARERVTAERRKVAEMIGAFMAQQADRIGMRLKIPPTTLARLVQAVSDALELANYLEGEDLFEPFLELLVSALVPKSDEAPDRPAKRAAAKPRARAPKQGSATESSRSRRRPS
jgi:AcrR family transcriptional regulator